MVMISYIKLLTYCIELISNFFSWLNIVTSYISSYLWNYFLSNVNLEWDLTTQQYDIMDYGPSY